MLYVAAMLHDLSLSQAHQPPSDAACFAVHGGAEARAHTLAAGADADFARQVDDAIAAHFNVAVPLSWGAEAHLLHAGAHFDIVGHRLREVAPSTVIEVLERTPRTGLADCVAAAMREEVRLRPRSRAALLQRLGMERAVRRAKFPATVEAGRVRSLAIGTLGALFVVLGAWAAVDSASFTDVLADFGAENSHLVHDFGAASVAVGACLLIAVRRVAWQAPMLVVATVWNGLHAVSHLADIGDAGSRVVGIIEAALLVGGTVLLGWLAFTSRETA